MHRGELYRVRRPKDDPKRARVFVVVSRTALLRSRFPTVICAPVATNGEGLSTQVSVGEAEGLKHPSWITCDGLTTIERRRLTDYVGSLSPSQLRALNVALKAALDL